MHGWPSVLSTKLEAGTEYREAVKSWIFEADCHRGYCLGSWIVTGDSDLASYKSDIAWLPGHFIADKGTGLLGRLLQVVCQSSVFIYSLATVCLHIQSLRFIRKG